MTAFIHSVTEDDELYRDTYYTDRHAIYLVPRSGPILCFGENFTPKQADQWYKDNPQYQVCMQTVGSTGPQINK